MLSQPDLLVAAQPTDPYQAPCRATVTASMPADRRDRSTAKGAAIFATAFALYFLCILGTLLLHSLSLRIVASLGIGLQASILFVIGHDACHNALTADATLNRWIARLSFLPSLHPYTTWKHSHNGLHHGWTNVRGKDMAFPPYSKEDFDRLPRWRQWAERWFRSIWGLGAFYFFTVYLPHELLPNRQRGPVGANAWRTFQIERIAVASYAIVLLAVALLAARSTHHSFAATACLTVIGPGAFYFALMSFVTFQHHTHPRAPWYDPEDFEYFSIVRSSVHVDFPRPIEILLHEIHNHTAHHADTMIPLYQLARSQRALEHTFADIVIRERWTFRGMVHTLKTSRLFDYKNHRWLDWDGTPLTPSLRETQADPSRAVW